MRSAAVKHGYDAGFRRKSALHMKRFPRAVLFVFANTIRVFSRMAQSGTIKFAGKSTPHISHQQTNRSPNRCVGTPSWSKHIAAAVYPELVAYRAIHDHQGSTTPGAYRSRSDVKHRVGNGLGGSE